MTAEELKQISVALFSAIKYNTSEGHMVAIETAFGILNTHCSQAEVSVGYDQKHLLLNFTVHSDEAPPVQKTDKPAPNKEKLWHDSGIFGAKV